MKPAVFVLSSGRCGTKFVADAIRLADPDHIEAWHERITIEAGARRFFRKYEQDALNECRKHEPIREFLDAVRGTTKSQSYLDSGFTLHSLFPLLISEFGDRVKFVFQIRHPFDTAASLAIKGAYRDAGKLKDWHEHCFLHSEDNVFHGDVPWSRMTEFEKGLWRWGELALYWEELKERFPDITWEVVKAEDLFGDPTLITRYFELLECPAPDGDVLQRCAEAAHKNETRDDWQYWLGLGSEWQKFYEFPWVVQLAEKYGYPTDRDTIRSRYQKYKKPLDLWGRLKRKLTASHSEGS